MNSYWMIVICMGLGIASTLVGGVFLAFSDFVMRGLGAADASAGVDAMQQINRVVYRSIFLTAFMALVPTTIALVAYGWWIEASNVTILATAAVIYFITVFLVTAFGNVPMNQQLDPMALGEQTTEAYWQHYLSRWTVWNHVRTLGCVTTGVCYFVASVFFASTLK